MGRAKKPALMYIDKYIITLAKHDFVMHYLSGSGASAFDDWVIDFSDARQFFSRSAAMDTLAKLKLPFEDADVFIEEHKVPIKPLTELYDMGRY